MAERLDSDRCRGLAAASVAATPSPQNPLFERLQPAAGRRVRLLSHGISSRTHSVAHGPSHMHLRLSCLLVVLFSALATTSAARAQCSASYVPGLGMPGVDNRVDALTTWDPDGAGPASPVVVLGGDFLFAGTTPANRVVAWQPQSGRYENLDQFGVGDDFGIVNDVERFGVSGPPGVGRPAAHVRATDP